MASLVVREFARVGIGETKQVSIDEVLVPERAFDWLCQENERLRKSGAALVQLDGRRWLRLDNYVGVIETPCGTRIEILPKSCESYADASRGRKLLQRMLARCLDLHSRETAPAGLQTFKAPVTEWIMRQFLAALDRLIKRGVCFEYHSVQEQHRFLRGRLLTSKQIRKPPGRDHIFSIEHDVFDADRPENRLLKSALELVCRSTREPGNWRLAHELAAFLNPVPPSRDVEGDFKLWRDDRLTAHYRPVRPLCELILSGQTPLAVAGDWRGLSLLFPMEAVFERYVERTLRTQLGSGLQLKRTPSSEYLCAHLGSGWFNLQPDLMIIGGGGRWILDTKWKRIDEAKCNSRDKYAVRAADMYQLFAYGHKYLGGKGDVVLVYPLTTTFTQPLPVFQMGSQLRLWMLPYDLDADLIVGLEHAGIIDPTRCHSDLPVQAQRASTSRTLST